MPVGECFAKTYPVCETCMTHPAVPDEVQATGKVV